MAAAYAHGGLRIFRERIRNAGANFKKQMMNAHRRPKYALCH